MTDAERDEALIHMVNSGAFPDDVALARWSITAEAAPVLRRWLEEGRRPLPRHEGDVDIEAAEREIAAQDALAAHIQARFGLNAANRPDAHTVAEMFELGWFGQGLPFWRWIETPAAAPYITACAAMRRAPAQDEVFDAFGPQGDAMDILDDPAALAELATRIEAEHAGEP